MLRKLFYKLSINQRYFVRRLVFFPVDLWNSIFNKRELVPPKGKIFIGSGDFIQQGENHLHFLKKHANLQPNHTVLDVGSGIGRTAVALTKYLNKDANYFGFDVVKQGVDWCQKNITKRFSNFQFQWIDIDNDLYHTSSKKADKFTFPYPDNSFDVVYLFSVFTHMEQQDVEQYIKEIYRVLKPNGRCLTTVFLIASEADATANVDFTFPYDFGTYKLMDKNVKGANIAFKQDYFSDYCIGLGFEKEKLIKGYWSGLYPKNDNDFQDIIVLKK